MDWLTNILKDTILHACNYRHGFPSPIIQTPDQHLLPAVSLSQGRQILKASKETGRMPLEIRAGGYFLNWRHFRQAFSVFTSKKDERPDIQVPFKRVYEFIRHHWQTEIYQEKVKIQSVMDWKPRSQASFPYRNKKDHKCKKESQWGLPRQRCTRLGLSSFTREKCLQAQAVLLIPTGVILQLCPADLYPDPHTYLELV